MQEIWVVMQKEFRQIFRIREMIAIIFVMPLIQMALLGFAISTEVKNVKLVVADQDNSFVSRELVRAFTKVEQFKLVGHVQSEKEIDALIHNWQAQLALVVPKNFGRDLQRGSIPEIQVIVDGMDGQTAGVAMGYAAGVLNDQLQKFLTQPQMRQLLRGVHMVNMQERMWYNPNLSPEQYMVPGIVVLLLTIVSMMLSAMSLVREKEIGTLEQLMVTPLKKHQLIFGKVIPFLILAFVEFMVVLQIAQWIFQIEMVGSLPLLSLLALLYLFATLGLGVFISTITTTQQQAMFVAWFFMVFMIIMGGFLVPIENMPPFLQKLTYINPMRYFMYMMRDIFQKGSSLHYLLKDAIPMTAYGVVIFTASVLKFQKRVS
ncbi:MAG: ABC transporter permease [Deferribacteres bacterium]|nr:ABC transporter permease [candidate division KSB1 bacterium]MCB9503552.1 ABC transporter permease [Deferribacteres bacterium]